MQQWYQCPSCGATVAFGIKFCGNCGAQLNWPVGQQHKEYPANSVQRSDKTSLWDRASKALIGKSGASFNKANEQWRRAKFYSLGGNDEKVKEACLEVVRLCQQAISVDSKNGDAYVLLANALIQFAGRCNLPSDEKRYHFLLTRAASVIHFWHCLPYRGYPITKNKEIGERLWRNILEQLMHDKGLAENPAIALMDSYKDNFAAETISPSSFTEIRGVVLQIT